MLEWAKQAGGAGADDSFGIAMDGSGNSYVTGFFQGSATFGAGELNETTLVSASAIDIFVAKYAPKEPTLAFLHGSGANANPAVLFLDSVAPTSSTAKYRDSAAIKFSGGNPWKLIGAWTAEPEFFTGSLTTLSDLRVWLGLKNSDDQGTRFDLAAEVRKNGDLVAEGETLCITGVTRNAALAKEVTVIFQPFSPVTFNGSSDVLSIQLLTRIGTNGSGGFCGGHSNATGLRLYFDAADRDSGFSVNPN
jgi:Beta-propeller repeat